MSLLSTEYVVLHSENKSATILQDNQEKAVLKKADIPGAFELIGKDPNQKWKLTNKVDGEFRPFSICCYTEDKKSDDSSKEEPYLKIKYHIFSHGDNFYSVGEALPSDSTPRDHLSGSKYICRLVNFPFSHLDHIDEETRHQMKRHRGIAVGDFYGLGGSGFHVKTYGEELLDVGLPLTASVYLLYTTR